MKIFLATGFFGLIFPSHINLRDQCRGIKDDMLVFRPNHPIDIDELRDGSRADRQDIVPSPFSCLEPMDMGVIEQVMLEFFLVHDICFYAEVMELEPQAVVCRVDCVPNEAFPFPLFQ